MGGESSKPISSGKRHSRHLSAGSSGDSIISPANGGRCALSSNNISTLSAATSKFGTSNSCNENLLGAGLSQQESRSRSGSGSSPGKPKKSPITLKNRQLIQSCFQNPHENLGKRILKRTAEKRKDFARFYMALNFEQKDDIEETIKTLLKKCVANIEFTDEVQRLASEFGGHFVKYRQIGFKADYFSTIGDATITECVFLDNAVHQAHQTLNAFSQFIAMLLSSVRDGFYNEMKRLRRTSNSFSTGSNGSGGNDRKTTSGSCDVSPRSASPATESLNTSNTKSNAVDEEQQEQNAQESSSQEEDEKKEAEKENIKSMDNAEKNTDYNNGQDAEKLARSEATLNCNTIVKENRTVTFQTAELDTVAVSTKSNASTNDEAGLYVKPKEKLQHDAGTFGCDSEKNDNATNLENENQEAMIIKSLDDSSVKIERRGSDSDDNDKKCLNVETDRNIVSANLPQYNNSPRKNLLPPSVAAIFES